MRTSSVNFKRSCFWKKMSSRKQFCVKISEQLVDRETPGNQEAPLLRTAVCPVITTRKKNHHYPDLQPCRCWSEGRRGETAAGRGRGSRNRSACSIWFIPPIFATASLCPTALFWFLHNKRINLLFFASL